MSSADNDIAIVGIGLRVPGAANAAEYWRNLREGKESIRLLTEAELLGAGVPREEFMQPTYVPRGAPLERMDYFDAEFFGFSPKEAAIMDPQHRHFLEVCWEAFEDAGHVPEGFDGAIGIFAGCGEASYFSRNLITNEELVQDVGLFLLRHTGNDKDFLSTRASYLLNLRGPSLNVQTACSTSLVATHLACQSLLSGECDIALAGGVTIENPHGRGYHYEPGEILSPDGHCRAFDHRSEGTVFGSGAGVVVLRRLEDALADGDRVYAVIKGTAINNDGSSKVGYLAPSVEGQAACIAEALAVAEIEPDTIRYIECHGTGTRMGDPIEVAALTQAFRNQTQRTQFCGIGSVKTNIGHLDTAAGVASLAKTALALYNQELPASLNFEKENPHIEFEDSPFFVQKQSEPWDSAAAPRRAGVNSLGVGGTNAFAILEEFKPEPVKASAETPRLLTLSARNRAALDDASAELARHLRANPDLDLGDVSWTLQVGRRAFAERRVLAARNLEEAATLLESKDPRRVFNHAAAGEAPDIVFMFPGGGSQYARMAADLYEREPAFAKQLDEGFRLLKIKYGIDLKPLLLCEQAGLAAANKELEAPSLQLPAIFLVEHAMATLLMSWGIKPSSFVGHSLGENTAACLSGTIGFEDCLGLVVLRGRLMDRVAGTMAAVPLPAEELQPYLDEFQLDLAAINAPDLCVASGTVEAIAALDGKLREKGVELQRLKINIAAHSRLLEPVIGEFEAYLKSIRLSPPRTPWVSNRTGTWITVEEATSPAYWVQHLRGTVRFADCMATLSEHANRAFFEVGPGKTLSSLAKAQPGIKATHALIPTLRHQDEVVPDDMFLLTSLGRLWAAGGPPDTERLFKGERRNRIGLPTYRFQSSKFFIQPGAGAHKPEAPSLFPAKEEDEGHWFWEPSWKMREADDPVEGPLSWLFFADDRGLGDQLKQALEARGDTVVVVRAGDGFQRVSDHEYVLAPEHGRPGYDALVHDLVRSGKVPDRVVHLSLLSKAESVRPGSSLFHRSQEQGFYSLLFLAQAWEAEAANHPLHILVFTTGMQKARGDDRVSSPEQSTVLGPVKVIPREIGGVTVSCVDLEPTTLGEGARNARGMKSLKALLGSERDARESRSDRNLDVILAELLAPAANGIVALRESLRYIQSYRRTQLQDAQDIPLPEGATVLITGGSGGIGLAIAKELATTRRAKIALLSRSLGEGAPSPAAAELQAFGADCVSVRADVTDIDSMQAAVRAIKARFGSIDAVIHAAGTVSDAPLGAKDQAEVEKVFGPKVYGTLVLDEALKDEQLKLFVVFSSTSTAIAPLGQVDYVAANSFLNAFAEARSAGRAGRTIALNWGIWQGAGMAVRAAARMLGVDAPSEPASHPFFDERSVNERGVATLTGKWSAGGDWFLDEHRTAAGHALLPGTGYITLAEAALRELRIDQPFEVRDLFFLAPLAVDDVGRQVRVRLSPIVEGYSFEVAMRVEVEPVGPEGAAGPVTSGWRKVAQADLFLGSQPKLPSRDLAALQDIFSRAAPASSAQLKHLRFGPRWQVLKHSAASGSMAIGQLQLPSAFASDLEQFGLHPAMLDIATGFAMSLVEGYTGDALWVPVSYQSVRVQAALQAEVRSIVSVRPESSEASSFASFDVDITDLDGNVLVSVTDFTMKRLDGPFDVGQGAVPNTSGIELVEAPLISRALSKAEMAFQHNLSQGITVEEGRRTFTRAVSAARGQTIYVTSVSLDLLAEQATAAARLQSAGSKEPGQSFARPALSSDYLEARDTIEAALVDLWRELLGVDQVGVQDNFFDLGGHSLIAVRLFARIRRLFTVDFPISVLFEAPTIEGCAALIRSALPEGAGDTGAASAPASRPRFTHLVAMHQGEGGAGRPFFLVAGMFGNVLNLRHLATQIGSDRPFFGIQARGLFGEEKPHETFEEMARDYLQEVRSVQPAGPYTLGGFSGGGIAALEMARQLKEQGEEVDLLVMLDTPLPNSEPLTVRDKVRMQLQDLRRKGVRHVGDVIRNRAEWRRQQAMQASAVPVEAGALHSQAIGAAFHRALDHYDVQPYDGRVALFRPKLQPTHVFGPGRQINSDRRFIYEDNGWRTVAQEVEVVEVPGDHDSMVLEPNVRVLASRLRQFIRLAEDVAGAAAPVQGSGRFGDRDDRSQPQPALEDV